MKLCPPKPFPLLTTFVIFGCLAASCSNTSAAETAPAGQQNTNTVQQGTNRQQRVAVRFPRTEVKYEHGPDSQRKEGVPRGKVTDFDWTNSTVFPGTLRHCSLYVPAQYDSAKPAALMVFQDGHTYQKEDGDFR